MRTSAAYIFFLSFIFNAGPVCVLLLGYFGKSIPKYLIPKMW